MRISDWSSDVCSSDLPLHPGPLLLRSAVRQTRRRGRHRNNPATVWSAPLRGPAAPGKPFIILSELLSTQPLFKAMDCISCRSEERRVGKECVSTCSSRGSPYNYKKK